MALLKMRSLETHNKGYNWSIDKYVKRQLLGLHYPQTHIPELTIKATF